MKFTKMHGCGNDYVYVDATKEKVEDPSEAAVFLSDRHFGIGSDGLILIEPSQAADFTMSMYNADGSRGEMCGNGIRCVGKYVYDHGLTDKTSLSIETLAGIKELQLEVSEGKVASVRVDMGEPVFDVRQIPVIYPEKEMLGEAMEVDGRIYKVYCISMGNPHCVTFMEEDIRQLDLTSIGPRFENHSTFPKRINTEFANIIDRTHIRMRVWERGSGETLACGTGACATAVAAIQGGLTEDTVEVELLGGTLSIHYDSEKNRVYMTGPATEVFSGEIELADNFFKDDVKIYTALNRGRV